MKPTNAHLDASQTTQPRRRPFAAPRMTPRGDLIPITGDQSAWSAFQTAAS